MSLSDKGVSTTREADTFHCEQYYSGIRRALLWQWDYRDKAGTLFSGISKSREDAVGRAREFGYMGD